MLRRDETHLLFDRPRRTVLPLLPGLAVFTAGSALDLLYHLTSPEGQQALTFLAGEDGEWAHLTVMVGMILTVLGLALLGTLGQRRALRAADQGPCSPDSGRTPTAPTLTHPDSYE